MGFSRQECWSGWPCPPPGDLPDPGIEPESLSSPPLAGGLALAPLGSPQLEACAVTDPRVGKGSSSSNWLLHRPLRRQAAEAGAH